MINPTMCPVRSCHIMATFGSCHLIINRTAMVVVVCDFILYIDASFLSVERYFCSIF